MSVFILIFLFFSHIQAAQVDEFPLLKEYRPQDQPNLTLNFTTGDEILTRPIFHLCTKGSRSFVILETFHCLSLADFPANFRNYLKSFKHLITERKAPEFIFHQDIQKHFNGSEYVDFLNEGNTSFIKKLTMISCIQHAKKEAKISNEEFKISPLGLYILFQRLIHRGMDLELVREFEHCSYLDNKNYRYLEEVESKPKSPKAFLYWYNAINTSMSNLCNSYFEGGEFITRNIPTLNLVASQNVIWAKYLDNNSFNQKTLVACGAFHSTCCEVQSLPNLLRNKGWDVMAYTLDEIIELQRQTSDF